MFPVDSRTANAREAGTSSNLESQELLQALVYSRHEQECVNRNLLALGKLRSEQQFRQPYSLANQQYTTSNNFKTKPCVNYCYC